MIAASSSDLHIAAERLDEIREARTEKMLAGQRLMNAVIEAKIIGCTWAEIGRELGITRQSAQEKYGKFIEVRRTAVRREP